MPSGADLNHSAITFVFGAVGGSCGRTGAPEMRGAGGTATVSTAVSAVGCTTFARTDCASGAVRCDGATCFPAGELRFVPGEFALELFAAAAFAPLGETPIAAAG